jgi:hypothetical protein
MKKVFSLAGSILLVAFVLMGCVTTPAFNSLPEANPLVSSFVGTWTSYNAYVSETYGSTKSVVGEQCYYFYADGTGEIIDFNKGVVTNRRVFRYRLSDTLIGFQFLQGTAFTNGGSFSRPYTLSPNKRAITFPYEKLPMGAFEEFTLTKTTPEPSPPRTLVPTPEPIDNAGIIYYSYDGIGYVYRDNSVFYRCSDGKPVGYIEGGVIYSFNGPVLGFFEGLFIYDRNGYPKGAVDPKGLGLDAPAKRQVSRAGKQDLPAKQPKVPINKPRLRNGYFGGFLKDIFG